LRISNTGLFVQVENGIIGGYSFIRLNKQGKQYIVRFNEICMNDGCAALNWCLDLHDARHHIGRGSYIMPPSCVVRELYPQGTGIEKRLRR